MLGGSYALRGLQLYSLGTNTLYHRLNRGLEVRFPAVRVEEPGPAYRTGSSMKRMSCS
jgi:hypothetical protein